VYTLDPHGLTSITTSDGLTVPWRPILTFAEEAARLPRRGGLAWGELTLLYRGAYIEAPEGLSEHFPNNSNNSELRLPCRECSETGRYESPDFAWDCVVCRGTASVPCAFIGQDYS